jgi:hypothetical protein
MIARLLLGLVGLAAGCGYGLFSDDPGGAENLPTLGAGPYAKPELDLETPAEEPFILADSTAQLTSPSALARPDGGFRVWFTRVGDGDTAAEIWAAALPAFTELPDEPPSVALTADAAWEQGDVRDPSLLELADGTSVMFYAGGVDAPGIGRADSADGGESWVKHPDNPLVPSASSPAISEIDGLFVLAFSRPSEAGIWTMTSDDGEAFTDMRLALEPSEVAGTFDELSVGEPHLLARRSAAGRAVHGLFYVGERAADEDVPETITAIGYAGSFDAVTWQRFAGGAAVLEPEPPGERGPSALVGNLGGTLFFSELRQNRGRIGVAVHP